MAIKFTDTQHYSDIADAIRAKSGSATTYTPAEMPQAIEDIGIDIPDNDVIFIDYDGRILYSYTAAEFLQLSELPPNPTRSGLTAQGWNWTLADAQECVQNYGMVVIGQNYITSDGKTRVYVDINGTNYDPTLTLELGNVEVSIDWGDGTAPDTMTGSAAYAQQSVAHTYNAPGSYVISLTVTPLTSGAYAVIKGTANDYALLLNSGVNLGASGANTLHKPYRQSITRIELGANVKLSDRALYVMSRISSISIPISAFTDTYASVYAFSNTNLTGVVIPPEIQTINEYAIQGITKAPRLQISIPKSVRTINPRALAQTIAEKLVAPYVSSVSSYAFYAVSAVKISIPNLFNGVSDKGLPAYLFAAAQDLKVLDAGDFAGCTIIAANDFQNCSALEKLSFPGTVATISANAFAGCSGLRELHFAATTPPNMANKNALDSTSPKLKIYVPFSADHSVLNAYKAATNWSVYASQIYEEE